MVDALVTLAVAAWFVPFVLEYICRGSRSAYDAIARASIGSLGIFLTLIHVIALFGATSRLTFVLTAVGVAAGWVVYRARDVLEVLPGLELKRNWLVLLGPVLFVGIAAFSVLVQPHFSYKGYLIDSVGVTYVENEKILTPYFSDEWASVAFVDQALTTRSLPTSHPFMEKTLYVSYLTPYFMLLASFFSTLGINPLQHFAYAPLFIGMLLVFVAYICARSFGASRVASSIAALSVPFITNSANLAGIWYAIPAHVGLLVFVLTLSLQRSSVAWRIAGYVLSVFLYPPLLAFVVPVAMCTEERKTMLRVIGLIGGVSIVAILIGALAPATTVVRAFKGAFELVVRPLGLEFAGDIALYPPYIVLPFVAIIGFLFIVPTLWSKQRLAACAILIGLVGWIVYSIVAVTVVIDVQRVVFITAFLICVVASLGYDIILEWVKKTVAFNPTALAWALLVLVFSHVAVNYSADESWRKFKLHTPNKGEGTFLIPSPPASKYLIEEDLALLRRYDVVASSSPRRFVTTPWKGLVLGAATRHIPLHTKASIMGTSHLPYEKIATASCSQLEEYRIKNDIDFAYVPKLATCPNIIPVATSTEGFVLYEFHTAAVK